jgi:acyl-CoA hydrolase
MTQSLPPKRVAESAIHDQTALVFPNDLNSLGTLFGGRVLDLADRVTAVVSQRHSGRVCVTLGIDSVRFLGPARHGDILVFQSAVNRVWKTSMEVGVRVLAENFKTRERRHIFSAYFTFVALDDQGHPVEIAGVILETEQEQRRYRHADERRKSRLAVKNGPGSPSAGS